MNRAIQYCAIAFLALIASPALWPAHAQDYKEIGRTTEKELKVVVSSSFGSLRVAKGDPTKIVTVQNERSNGLPMNMDYAVRNRVGYMDLNFGEGPQDEESGKRFKFSGFKGGDWSLNFSDAIPISFEIEMGVGRGDINLSGLNIKDLNLSTGASDVCLAFDQPNNSTIENINVESGVSKFLGRNLGNANFRHFKFQGGVGTCTLDFTGRLQHEVDVDVEVGMGVMTIIVPWNIGARVHYEKNWMSKINCADDFTSDGEEDFVSKNYDSAQGKMNINVDSGVGSVKIVRPE